jgi:hypothetical protein
MPDQPPAKAPVPAKSNDAKPKSKHSTPSRIPNSLKAIENSAGWNQLFDSPSRDDGRIPTRSDSAKTKARDEAAQRKVNQNKKKPPPDFSTPTREQNSTFARGPPVDHDVAPFNRKPPETPGTDSKQKPVENQAKASPCAIMNEVLGNCLSPGIPNTGSGDSDETAYADSPEGDKDGKPHANPDFPKAKNE